MTKSEIYELTEEVIRSLRIRRAEAIAHICGTGLSQDLAKRIWLYSVQNELHVLEGSLNIRHTQDFTQVYSDYSRARAEEASD